MERTILFTANACLWLELARHPAFADDAPELAGALRDVLAHYAPEALECDDWVLSGNTQTDAILRAARAALTKAWVKL